MVMKGKSLILKREKFLVISIVLILTLNCFSSTILSPVKTSDKNLNQIFEEAKQDFLKGDLNATYRKLLLINTFKGNPEYDELLFLTLIGLKENILAIDSLNSYKNSNEKLGKYYRWALERSGLLSDGTFIETEKVMIKKENLKKVNGILFDNPSFYLLKENMIEKYGKDGKILETIFQQRNREGMILENLKTLMLSVDSITLPEEKIILPLKIENPISITKAPFNNFYLLDDKNTIYTISYNGNIVEKRELLIKNPRKIRTDNLFRIYILSKDGSIYVYGASFEPLYLFKKEEFSEKFNLSRVIDFYVDFIGNLILLSSNGDVVFVNNEFKLIKRAYLSEKFDFIFFDGYEDLIGLNLKSGIIKRFKI